jgi:hypothetical protein
MELGGVPTQDLIDELEGRFEHYVFVAQRKGLKQPADVVSKYYNGDIIVCLGLTDVMHDFIMKDYPKKFKDIDENEV